MAENGLQRISSGEMLDSTKSYFKRPEGVVGWVGIPLSIGATVWAGAVTHVWSNLVNGMYDIAQLGVGVAVAGGIVMLVTSKKVRVAAQILSWHFYNKWIKTIDPVERIEFALVEQQKLLKIMRDKLSIVTGYIDRLKGFICENEENIQKYRGELEEMVVPGTQTLKTQYAGNEFMAEELADKENLLVSQNRDFNNSLQVFESLDEVISKNVKLAQFTFNKTKFRQEMICRSRNALAGARGAVDDIRAILSDGEFKRIGSQAEEEMLTQITNDIGFFKNFVRETEPLTAEMDLARQVTLKKALERISNLKGNDRILAEYKQENGQAVTIKSGPNTSIPAPVRFKSDFGKTNLFDSISNQ